MSASTPARSRPPKSSACTRWAGDPLTPFLISLHPLMQKDFDNWNIIKQRLHSREGAPLFFPKAREVWMCSIGRNIGFEQNGGGENFSRPVLVVKKFNNQMFWTAPLSTKQKQFDFYYNFTDLNKMPASVILAQLKLTSIKRFLRKIYEFPEDNFNEVYELLILFLKNRKPS